MNLSITKDMVLKTMNFDGGRSFLSTFIVQNNNLIEQGNAIYYDDTGSSALQPRNNLDHFLPLAFIRQSPHSSSQVVN